MMLRVRLILVCALGTLMFGIQVHAQSDGVLATAGGVEAVWTNDATQPLDGDLVGGVLSLRTAEGSSLVTFENISISNVYNVQIPGLFAPTPIATAPYPPQAPADWAATDSHILITADMVGGGAGAGFDGLREPVPLNPTDPDFSARLTPLGGNPPPAGAGTIDTPASTDAFFLKGEFQQSSIDFAHLVLQPGTTTRVTINVLGDGDGLQNCADGQGACFDFEIGGHGHSPIVSFDGATEDPPGSGSWFGSYRDGASPGEPLVIGIKVNVLEDSAGDAAAAGPTVDLVTVDAISNDMGKWSFIGEPLPVSIKAGTPYFADFAMDTSMVGTFGAEYLLSFSDGTTLSASLTGTVLPEPGAFSMLGLAGMMLVGYVRRRR